MQNTELTIDQFKRALPPQVKKNINQELMTSINKTIADPLIASELRDNVIGYCHVLKEGKFKIPDYVNAVKYVSFKLMGNSNIESYIKTFPDKYQRWLIEGVTEKDMSSYVSMYNKTKLVNLILEQTLVPMHVLNAELYQKALNTQAHLMATAKSEKVRSDAANSVLTHLKPPEKTEIELNVSHKESSVIDELRKTTMALAEQQRTAIGAGAVTAQQVAHTEVVAKEADIEEAEYREL